jgi:hypothetical protein
MVQATVSGRPCHQRLAASNTAVSNSAKEPTPTATRMNWNSGVALIILGQKSRFG